MEHASYAQPIVSVSDTRTYKYLELDNKLAVCLISDPTTEIGAAACDVNVGSFSDPEDVAGLAHFLGTDFNHFS
jgi:insulysin